MTDADDTAAFSLITELIVSSGNIVQAEAASRGHSSVAAWLSTRAALTASRVGAISLIRLLGPQGHQGSHVDLASIRPLLTEMAECAWGVGFIIDRATHRAQSLVRGREDLIAITAIWTGNVDPQKIKAIRRDPKTGRYLVNETGFVTDSYAKAIVHLSLVSLGEASRDIAPKVFAKSIVSLLAGPPGPSAVTDVLMPLITNAGRRLVQRLNPAYAQGVRIMRAATVPAAAGRVVFTFGEAARKYYEGFGQVLPPGPPRSPSDAEPGRRSSARRSGATDWFLSGLPSRSTQAARQPSDS